MKKIILSVSIALIASATLSSCSSEPDSSKRYFLESGDSVITSVEFSTKMRFDSYRSEGRLEYRNDSILLGGGTEYNEYGESSQLPDKFVATFNEDGIVNTEQLMAFVNAMDSTDAVITKVTIK